MKGKFTTEKVLTAGISLLLLITMGFVVVLIPASGHAGAPLYLVFITAFFLLVVLLLLLFWKEQKQNRERERKINKANRLYFFISQANQMIIKTPEEEILFKEACRIAVDVGKFRMAWVGLIDEETKELMPVAYAGEEKGYLSKINIALEANIPEGRGPTGTAIREGKYAVCNDIEKNPEMVPWKEAAMGRGYYSSISLPLKKNRKVVGAFNLYAPVADFFNKEEIELLEGIAGDISFSLGTFEKEKLRKKAEETLHASETRYRRLFETAKDGILILDADTGVIVDANPFLMEMLNYSLTELKGKRLWEIGLFKDISANRESFQELQKEEYARYEDLPLETKAGYPIWVEFVSNIYEVNGKKVIQCNIRNISDRKKTENELRKNENDLKRGELIAKVGYWQLNIDENIIYFSEGAQQIYGTDKATMSLEEERIFHLPEYNRMMDEALNALVGGEKKYDVEFQIKRRNDKKTIDIHSVAEYHPETHTVFGVIQDITSRKRAEEELRNAKLKIEESEIKFSSITNQATEGIALSDIGGNYKFVNPAFCKMTGYAEDELLSMTVRNLKAKKQPFIFFKDKREKRGLPLEVSLQRKDGSEFIAEIIERVIKVRGQEFVLDTVRDISERQKAEEEIRNSNERFELVARATNDVIWDWNLLNDKLWWNNNYYSLFGYSNSQMPSDINHWINNIHPDDRTSVVEGVHKSIDTGAQYWQDEYRYRCDDGRFLFIYDRGYVLHDENGKPYRMIGSMLDISEQVKTQEKIKETTEQLRQLTAHLQTIREEERKRIGREIHDELGQQLTAIKMDVAWMDKKINPAEILIKSKLKNILTLLDGSNASVRKILNELRPSLLDDLDLPEALLWQGQQFTDSTGIPVVFTAQEMKAKLPEEIATCIFRVYQESLTNIMRYAQARKVLTSLSMQDGNIILTVEDDGKGFDMTSVQNKKSFGILGMKERVLSLDGTFKLITSPGKGAKIIVSLPFKG